MSRYWPGAAALGLAWVLTASSSCRRPPEERADEFAQHFPEQTVEVEQLWYRVLLRGLPAGRQRLRVSAPRRDKQRLRVVDTETELLVRLGGGANRLIFRQQLLIDERQHLLLADWQEIENGQPVNQGRAGIQGDRFLVDDGNEPRYFPARPPLVWPLDYRLFFTKPPAPGSTVTFRTWNSFEHRPVEKRLEILARLSGGGWRAHLGGPADPAPEFLELDQRLRLVRARQRLGALELELVRVEREPPRLERAVPLTPLPGIAFRPPRSERWPSGPVRYRLRRLPDGLPEDFLSGPSQKLLAHPAAGEYLVECRPQALPASSPPPPLTPPPGGKRFLAASPLLPLTSPRLREVVEARAGAGASAVLVARRLRRFVTETIAPARRLAFTPADRVLELGRGDCTEQSILLVALLRASGIPARAVLGLVWREDVFWRHMWVEAWLGRDWRALDPAQGVDAIDGRWLRLGWLPLDPDDEQLRRRSRLLLEVFASDLLIELAGAVDGD